MIEAGEVVLCDFGGTMHARRRRLLLRHHPLRLDRRPGAARRGGRGLRACCTTPRGPPCAAATVGTACEDVDAAARTPIAEAGWGERFIHRTGHGIGIEEHEDPYIVAGNREPLAAGPRLLGRARHLRHRQVGLRLEDIVVATDAGPDELNQANHDLVVVDA